MPNIWNNSNWLNNNFVNLRQIGRYPNFKSLFMKIFKKECT